MKKLFIVGVLLNWIIFAIIGSNLGDAFSTSGGWERPAKDRKGEFTFYGILVGTWINVVLGGFMVAYCKMDENLEILAKNASRNENTSSGSSSGNSPVNTQPVNLNYGDTWLCKKCKTTNSNNSPTCKDCGAYK